MPVPRRPNKTKQHHSWITSATHHLGGCTLAVLFVSNFSSSSGSGTCNSLFNIDRESEVDQSAATIERQREIARGGKTPFVDRIQTAQPVTRPKSRLGVSGQRTVPQPLQQQSTRKRLSRRSAANRSFQLPFNRPRLERKKRKTKSIDCKNRRQNRLQQVNTTYTHNQKSAGKKL